MWNLAWQEPLVKQSYYFIHQMLWVGCNYGLAFPSSVGTHLRTIIFYCISCKKSEVICSAGHQEGSSWALSKWGTNVLSCCPRIFYSNLKHASGKEQMLPSQLSDDICKFCHQKENQGKSFYNSNFYILVATPSHRLWSEASSQVNICLNCWIICVFISL